jgi:Sulfatase
VVDIGVPKGVIIAPPPAASMRLPKTISWALVVAAFVLMGVFFWRNEWPVGNFVFSLATTAALAAALTVISGRVLFATLIAGAQVVIVSVAALVKLKFMDMLVHAYDLFFYFRSLSTVAFLAREYPLYTFGLFGCLSATLLLGALLWWVDGARVSRWKALGAALVLAGVALAGQDSTGQRRHMHLYYPERFLSTYYGSWPETLETLWRGQMIEAAPTAPGQAFDGVGACATSYKKPHVILIHQESMVPPSHFRELQFDKAALPFFQSFDGSVRKMRVETYGGASWLTEFSVLAGVSTYSFGTMRQFVQAFMEGRVRETIPQVMEACGYRNVLFYPMMKNFVSNARFYESIGLKEIFDQKAQGAASTTERDRFYYANALDEVGRHLKSSDKPLFTFIQTMSGHWPYDVKYFPEVEARGGGPGTHPELSEYLRRVSIAAGDYSWLRAELKRRFPSESFVIVNYGDHQPSATRMLLGISEATEVEDVKLKSEGPGFLTYYSVETQNWRAPALANVPVLDVPYLGLALLEAARLPLSDAYKERKRLMTQCQGRYHSCADEGAIMAFHRRLIDSGLMDAR